MFDGCMESGAEEEGLTLMRGDSASVAGEETVCVFILTQDAGKCSHYLISTMGIVKCNISLCVCKGHIM